MQMACILKTSEEGRFQDFVLWDIKKISALFLEIDFSKI
jgi:hypothetical protein